jgi:hypothetical protein
MIAPRTPHFLYVALLTSVTCLIGACSADIDKSNDENAVTAAARDRLASATVELAATLEACSQKEKAIDANAFSDINLSAQQFGIALSYLSVKANNNCIQQAAGKFAIAARVMQQTQEKKVDSSDQSTGDYADLVVDSVLREIELHAEFLQLPEGERKKVEAIAQLTTPFDAVGTMDGLNRVRH